jgi:hypothetical protein
MAFFPLTWVTMGFLSSWTPVTPHTLKYGTHITVPASTNLKFPNSLNPHRPHTTTTLTFPSNIMSLTSGLYTITSAFGSPSNPSLIVGNIPALQTDARIGKTAFLDLQLSKY